MEHSDRIDIAHPDIIGNLEDNRGVVEDGAHTCLDQQVCNALANSGGHGDDRQTRVLLADNLVEVVEVLDRQIAYKLAELGGVAIEECDELQALAAEALVARDGLPQVAHAHEHYGPAVGEAEDALDMMQQLLDIVADTLLAELAEVGEIFADLGSGNVDALAELLRGDRENALLQKIVQAAGVERQPADHHIRGYVQTFHGSLRGDCRLGRVPDRRSIS